MGTTPWHRAAIIAGMVTWGIMAGVVQAKEMPTFDLDSLVDLSSDIIEGEVVEAKIVNYTNVLTVKVTTNYAGASKTDDQVIVGLSAYRKGYELQFVTINGKTYWRGGSDKQYQLNKELGVGDKLILFIEPARREWREDGIPYWPVPSGVKVVADGKVTGMRQIGNPGPYENAVNEGEVGKFHEKIATAIKTVAAFKKDLATKKGETEWLLEKLAARVALPTHQEWHSRDWIAVRLCEALAKTGDKNAIAKAKNLTLGEYEREMLLRVEQGE